MTLHCVLLEDVEIARAGCLFLFWLLKKAWTAQQSHPWPNFTTVELFMLGSTKGRCSLKAKFKQSYWYLEFLNSRKATGCSFKDIITITKTTKSKRKEKKNTQIQVKECWVTVRCFNFFFTSCMWKVLDVNVSFFTSRYIAICYYIPVIWRTWHNK